jgi:hypothetical protein
MTASDELSQMDLAFVVDTTGSMEPFIDRARAQMTAMLRALTDDALIPISLYAGVVEYRDHPPEERSFVFRVHRLNGSLKRVQKTIDRLAPKGGGDAPEAVCDGLCAAWGRLNWRPYSRWAAVLVGDAPLHGHWRGRGDRFRDGCPAGLTLDGTTAMMEESGIILQALGLTREVEEPFSRLARYTGGQYSGAKRGADAIEAIRTLLAAEFSNLEFDRRVRAFRAGHPGWTVDVVCDALGSPRGQVSASLSRLGRRRLL